MKRILSGIRPTGAIHLGNYLGAIRNWVSLQYQAQENLFCIVDLHALTESQTALAEKTLATAATYLACGIDCRRSVIFAQSHVPSLTQLTWIFSCLTPLGWLNRMTQFKDKAGKHSEQASLGLYAYPVLMAADILLYQATHVPVGEDQKQHLELSRDLACAFNHRFKREHFTVPEPLITEMGARVMSLRDGSIKMSKTDNSDYSRINVTDAPDLIALKIRKARTDPHPLPATPEELNNRPEAKNLLTIFAALNAQTLEQVCRQYAGKLFADFKPDLIEVLVNVLQPIREKIMILLADNYQLEKILHEGGQQANALAEQNFQQFREAVGLLK